ncbi:hypothetical protein A8F94_16280 [Bacillus sp. FJAT-27225]|uniref:hypothetical protein n=1 Tax=Bacillus sp. FJAT-27225 TaxID=1743144 RepID=UPI00080C28E7|nr:hypothetical protein [Bacillus sp. FJAT-27225]OCA84270.1 hypothetical protein A8F94_16280 [Bacillus sp. FJAT-27225]
MADEYLEQNEPKESEGSAAHEDRFSRMMFGTGRRPVQPQKNENPLFELFGSGQGKESIDYALLLDVIEGLANSAEKLKPVISKIYPHIQQFLKK